MTATSHYHDRIARATERLAQLQAQELLANKRRESKAKEVARREEAKRRQHVAGLVFLTGAQALDDAELVGVLLQHLDSRQEQAVRTRASELGARRLSTLGSSETAH
ncbi:hypothetical protein NB717_000139 [Xanthomonas sacchari]|uniref:conjugal transfer protein TraD n=1 Tax=Xanthomonas sacchari TaxID=56458 RepID=UPI00225E515A|nr:conjugal transfer protein TraD [Xanthomonas sacchari]MCW0459071.1 hypothetical protein [Xanthomonas sacchari]